MKNLPNDILYLVCAQLWQEQDLDTLFKCACSWKQLSLLAVTFLYRMHDLAPNPSAANIPDEWSLKWEGLWRSLLMSSLGKTMFPYSRYIRTLDLKELEKNLAKSKLKNRIDCIFNRAELAQFKVYKPEATESHDRFDVMRITSRIGEALTKHTPQLEMLTGEVPSKQLSRWIPRLPQLTRLTSGLGTVTRKNGSLIRRHCPSFKELEIVHSNNDSHSDRGLAGFLQAIQPQSLESFQLFSDHDLRPESFEALSCHKESLARLKINRPCSRDLSKLSRLKECTNLVLLSLTGNWINANDPGEPTDDDFLETVVWLKQCKKLRSLDVDEFFRGAGSMAPILSESSIRLTSLVYVGPVLRLPKSFYQALANQTTLEVLKLEGEVGENSLEVDDLVGSLCSLLNLSELRLREISNLFDVCHVEQLAICLTKLEILEMDGEELGDCIWDHIACLKSLRRLELKTLIAFTAHGILNFVDKIQSDEGFVLVMTDAGQADDLDLGEISTITEVLAKTWDLEPRFSIVFNDGSEMDSLKDQVPSEDEL